MKKLILLLAIGLLNAVMIAADVRMPLLFGDHMVLQQNTKLTIRGWADPGEKVSVIFAGNTRKTTASADGSWEMNFKPLKPKSKGETLTIKGNNTLLFQDVLVGDVWVASGQSNMEWGIKNKAYTDDVDKSDDPLLRLFFVPKNTSLQPLSDIRIPDDVQNPEWAARWVLCTPEALNKINGQGFSSTAYYFARDIRKATGQAIGVIQSAWGGTRAEAWTSLSGLDSEPVLSRYIAFYEKNVKDNPIISVDYKEKKAAWDIAVKGWNETAPRPEEPKKPDGGNNGPTNLFNAMISPLIPFAIKGVIWYQGEFNSGGSAKEYATLFPTMISDWRKKWGIGDFPFVFVQLPNYGPVDNDPNAEGEKWRWVRDAQTKTLALPNTAMAVTIDVGDPFDMHPIDKYDVGHRLALVTRQTIYGEKINGSSPMYDNMTIDGNRIILTFKNKGSGLVLGTSPYIPAGEQAQASPTRLTGFAIAGPNCEFIWADAVIDGNKVIVSNANVQNPVAVRYAFSNNPICNLYNKEGLPASPFRTDDWE
ncbi:MAG: sialate O-acetylesterase [Dysgonamonadaceae bacterium]|nr:sialate O-acetylesterase [Dysgonamonadaceae bacterium]